jgi:type IV fimbrial biogenesis protein FimT
MLSKTRAFSILEVMLVLIIATILLFISMPMLNDVFSKNQSRAYVEQLMASLQFARLAAISRGETVRFCKSKDHKTCGGDWSDGQIITVNRVVLRVLDGVPSSSRLIWKGSFSKNDYLEFLPSGMTNAQQGSFSYCPKDLKGALTIMVQQTGHARVVGGTKC